MAPLRYCYNWDMLHHQQLNNNYYQEGRITSSTTGGGGLYQETEEVPELLAPELHGFHDDFTLADTCIDPLFEPPPPPPPEANNNNNNNNNTKRQKHNYSHDDHQFCLCNNSNNNNNNNIPSNCFLDGYVFPNSTTTPPPPPPPPAVVLPSFWPTYSCGSSSTAAKDSKKSNGVGSLSAECVAARRRRKKISEKTEELGTLVPGGGRKMNTAEMFQAAFKYVKYLQAQVGMLELMGSSIQKNEDPLHHQKDLQVLLASPIIQEKLYSEEKCLVSEGFVRDLANDSEIQSNPLIMTEINQLLQVDG